MNGKGKIIDRVFRLGVVLKGIDGIFEIIGGILLFLISPGQIGHFIAQLTQHELQEDPRDVLFNLIIKMSHQLSAGTEFFTAVYFMAHGVIKVGLIAALLSRKLWAYPAAIIFFALFGVYQIYRYLYTHSVLMIVLTFFDAVVIALTWLEYKRIKPAHP
ncbi:MAG: DUF2127 domain-containing protein [Nitrospiraceae bacterium]|nr:DUF2127 domain-containing protein [Nitrospiraceae bacterium]MDA8388064.1 DUF2127 domain-containing protein [Nitrospiraceae bacterium]